MSEHRYIEEFDDGPGGWFGWISNSAGPKPLEIRNSCAITRSPWWIDYNHAPPGVGYLHLLYMLMTSGPCGEHHRQVAGKNRFVEQGCSTNFTGAKVSLRLRGELLDRGAQLVLLIQAVRESTCSGWLLTGQPFSVTDDWTEQTVSLTADEDDWTNLGSRHDRQDYYGKIDLADVLRDVNTDILLVLHPLEIAPMGPIVGDPHRLRPEQDYPVWRGRLPEGYVELDRVAIEFKE